MDKYEVRKQKVGFAILVILSITFLVFFVAINFFISLAGGMDEVILGIPFIVIVIITPILIILWIYNFMKSQNKSLLGSNLKSIGISLIKTIITVLIIGYFAYQFSFTRYGGTVYVESKLKDGGSYYLIIDQTPQQDGGEYEIMCKEDIYNLVKGNETYMLDYQISTLKPERGQLLRIRLLD